MKRKKIFICLYLIVFHTLIAQQVVSGRITDVSDGSPVADASVFIANTTVGTATDESGSYSLTVPGRGSFEIVVSHIGYQSLSHIIDAPQSSHQYNASLTINTLEEITIQSVKTYKKKDVDLFWREILGEKPSKNGMEVLNPEKVYYYLNSYNVLKAICREPVEIINHHTGYRILYVLQRFEHDYRTDETNFQGMPSYEELVPANSRQQARWIKKRQEVFKVSLIRFIRSLYHGKIQEDGFQLINQNSLLKGEKTPVHLADLLQYSQDSTLVTIREPLLLICYAKPVTEEMIQNSFAQSNANNVRFDPYAKRFVTTVEKRQESNMVYVGADPMVELPPQQITIYADGSYRGLLKIQENQRSLSGLSSKLPVEYTDFSLSVQSTGNISNSLVKADENILSQLESYPQEKIHLHTDRNIYIPGEKIWFKAYLVDAQSHISVFNSQYVYVELLSPDNTLISRIMITQFGGLFCGHLPISEFIPEGYYTLRAYTRYMENMGDDFFFKKNIRIGRRNNYESGITNYESINRGNDSQSGITNYESRKEGTPGNLTNPQNPVTDYDVSFYPEGGNLLEGVLCKVAFKALNQNGYPESVSGTIIDDHGVEIASVQTYHAGMGVFNYQPVAGRKFYLQCTNKNGLYKQFELPQPNARAYSLSVSCQNNRIIFGVEKSINAPEVSCYLLIHCRGMVLYFEEWDMKKQAVTLPEEQLPAGLIQTVLFDARMNPLSERLIFSKNEALVEVEFQTDKEVYQIRNRIVSTLSFPDTISESLNGHFSVAVTDDKDIEVTEFNTILSDLLLSSELKGYIENPAYYLRDPVAMDMLMMTHGWRRYNIPEVVKGRLESPQIPFQQYQQLSGQVRTKTLNRPLRDSEILIMMKGDDNGLGITFTDENGLFIMPDLVFPDSSIFYIQALSRDERNNLVNLDIKDESFPVLANAPRSPFSSLKIKDAETLDETGINSFLEKAEQRAKFDKDLWTLHLKEVVVTAPRIMKNEPRQVFWANSSSDNTITREMIRTFHFSNVLNYLSLIGGVRVDYPSYLSEPIRIYVRGTPQLRGEQEIEIPETYNKYTAIVEGSPTYALVLIDGVERELNYGSLPSYNEIESIDVFKGPSAAAFGMRGGNGVVSITTRRGSDVQIEQTNNRVYTPLGYQKPAEFYSPRYETFEARQSPIPDYRTTIYWKPDLVISDNEGKATFDFYTSDYSTTYSVVIEGITDDGRIVRQVEKIHVE